MEKVKEGNLLQKIVAVFLFVALVIGITVVTAPTNALAQTEADGNEVRYSVDGGTTWKEASLMDVIWDTDVTTATDVRIELLRDITLVSTGADANWGSTEQLIGQGENSNWIIDGKGHMIKRGADGWKIFSTNEATSTITFKDITIDGGAVWNGTDLATRTNSGVKLSGGAQLIEICDGSTVILESGTILQNSDLGTTSAGSAISVQKGTLTIKDGVEIRNNRAKIGGAIFITGSDSVVNIEGGKIYGNQANDFGGGISNSSTLNITGGEIYNNYVSNHGGGVSNDADGTVNMTDGRIYNNYAKSMGGGVCSQKIFNMTGGKIDNNLAASGGGVLGLDTFTMSSGEISNNTAATGGGVYVHSYTGTTFNMNGGNIRSNNSTGNGGGVYCGGTMKMTAGSIDFNSASSTSGGGGGVYLSTGANFTIEGGTINNNNSVKHGAGVYNNGTFTMKNGQIKGNKTGASSYGGGVMNVGNTFAMAGGNICNNTAQFGGGVMIFSGGATITGGVVQDNITTDSMGGGVLFYDGTLNMSGNPVIIGNTDNNNEADNVYLRGTNIIEVTAPITDGAKIGVKKTVSDVAVAVTGACSADYTKYIYSDNELYYSALKDGASDNVVYLDFNNQVAPSITLPSSVTVHIASDADAVSDEVCAAIKEECLKMLQVSVDSELQNNVHYIIEESYDAQNNIYTARFCLTDEGKRGWYIAGNSAVETNCQVVIHRWSADWQEDETGHWHICSETDCDKASAVEAHAHDGILKTDAADSANHWYECSECGRKLEAAEHTHDETWKTDETDGTHHWHECTGCGAKLDVAEHTHNGTWKTDESDPAHHWYECSECGTKLEVAEHTHSGTPKTDESDPTHHWYECTECGTKLDIAEHTHNGTPKTDESDPTHHWYECTECGAKLEVAEHTHNGTPKTDESDPTHHWQECTGCGAKLDIAEHTHNGTWKTDESDPTHHWHECTECGAKLEVAAHTGNWKITEAATHDKEGLMQRKCTECGYGQQETIDKLPYTDEEKVADAKKVVEEALAGITATNETTREDIQRVIDEALTEAGIPDVTVTVGDITKTEATREDIGSIIGSIEIVSDNDENVNDNVNIEKIIAKLPYTEADKVADAKKVVEEALAGITATNETTKDDIQRVIDEALTKEGITDVTVTVGDITKTEATEENGGSITGNVEIVSKKDDTVKDSVPVEKTIEKLPKTEAEKVAEAKKEVENALADITVTNDTKKEDLQKEIDDALNKADITGVTATVGDFTKTEATEENEGSIIASVEIVSKKDEKVKDDLIINKTIAKLPAGKIETDKEQGANTPVTEFGDSKDSIIDAVLTQEDKNLVEDGTDIKIILTVDNIDASVAEADKQDIAEKIAENTETETYEVGEYLDINMYKLIGADRTKVSHTSGKIKIVLEVPDSLKNADSNKTRSYAVVRVHDGVAEILPDIDSDAATITIETDLFSTYAIVYKDSAIGGSGDGDDNPDKPSTGDGDSGTDKPNKGDTPNTGDTAPIRIYAILAMAAGLTYLSLLLGKKRKMTEQ